MGFVVVAVALSTAFIVGHDGSPTWRVARVVLTVLLGGLAWAAMRRPDQVPRICSALAIGLLAVPAGAGIGLPHLAKTGLGPLGIAGAVLLVGGLIMTFAAMTWLWRGLRHRAAIPAIIGTVAALLLLGWTLGQAVAATNVPRTRPGSATPANAGLSYRGVRFPASDGVSLSGWYVPSRNGAVVILLHGAGSTRSDVLGHAIALAQHGYGILLYDARGHGRSGGRAMDFGWYGDRDVAGAVAFVQRQREVTGGRIALVGMSMGGEEAIGAAPVVSGVRAVVAEGATNRVAGDKAWLSAAYGWRGALTEWAGAVTYQLAGLLSDAPPPQTLRTAVRAAAPRKMLLIAAGGVPDEALADRYIASGSPSSVELWVVPGAGHVQGLRTRPREWEARVVGFLDRTVGPRAGAG